MDTETSAENHSGDHILLCLSSLLTSDKLIEIAARMAKADQVLLTVLLLVPSAGASANENILGEDQVILQEKLELAGRSDNQIITIHGDNVAHQISGYAKANNVTKIVIGNSINKSMLGFCVQNNCDKLARLVFPDIEVYEVN